MRITSDPQRLLLELELLRNQLLKNLRPGQVVKAVTLSPTSGGSVRLQIGNTQVRAQTLIPLEPGQKLSLRVDSLGDKPELKLLQPPNARQLQAAAMKNALPRQQPLSLVLEKIQTTANKPSIPDSLPPAINRAITKVLTNILPSQVKPDPQQLRLAIDKSGVFLEPQLHQVKIPLLSHDLKANLLRLLFLLRPLLTSQGMPSPVSSTGGDASAANPSLASLLRHTASPLTPKTSSGDGRSPGSGADKPAQPLQGHEGQRLVGDLLRQTESALARIQFNQLHALPNEENPHRQVWQFDLPMQHREGMDNFHLRIEQDKPRLAENRDGLWTLNLHFNIDPLGPVHTRLILRGETISSSFWAERETTTELIQRNLDQLRAGFRRAGLTVEKLSAQAAKPLDPPPFPLDRPLLDEKI